MSARFVVSLALALAGTWAVAAPAAALEPGVFVDPGSPAGKEYTAPLSALRGDGSGHAAIENQPQPLFGSGITPARAGRGAASSQPTVHGRGRTGSAGHRPAAGVHRPAGGAHRITGGKTPPPAPAQLEAGGSAAPTTDVLIAAVLVVGLALGGLAVIIRRRLD